MHLWPYFDFIGHHDNGFPKQRIQNNPLVNVVCYIRIQRGERIVKETDVPIAGKGTAADFTTAATTVKESTISNRSTATTNNHISQ